MQVDRAAARRAFDEVSGYWPLVAPAQAAALRRWLEDESALGLLRARLDPEGHGLARVVPARILRGEGHPALRRAARGDAPRSALTAQLADDLRRWQLIQRLLPPAEAPAEGAAAPASKDPFRGGPPPWSAAGDRARLLAAFGEAGDWGELAGPLLDFVSRHGLGQEQGCVAFRLEAHERRAHLQPLADFAAFDLAWLAGNETRLAVLEENTRSFLDGYRAHNVLIWGPRGCGKSSAIRGLISRYWDRGLRGVEVPHRSYAALPQLFDLVRPRPERFVAVLDNVGLDRADPAMRALSTALDGGLERMPTNLVFYATSNFKDLVDREGERPQGPPASQVAGAPSEMRHTNETQSVVRRGFDPQGFQRLDERRALDDRFPLKVFVDLPTKEQYDGLVLAYARRAGLGLPERELLERFQVWRMRNNHDLVGGRTARDFVLSLVPAERAGDDADGG